MTQHLDENLLYYDLIYVLKVSVLKESKNIYSI